MTASDADRFTGRLFGLELGQDLWDPGTAFVDGVVERAGEDALGRLWSTRRRPPTVAEVRPPGPRLAGIDLPDAP